MIKNDLNDENKFNFIDLVDILDKNSEKIIQTEKFYFSLNSEILVKFSGKNYGNIASFNEIFLIMKFKKEIFNCEYIELKQLENFLQITQNIKSIFFYFYSKILIKCLKIIKGLIQHHKKFDNELEKFILMNFKENFVKEYLYNYIKIENNSLYYKSKCHYYLSEIQWICERNNEKLIIENYKNSLNYFKKQNNMKFLHKIKRIVPFSYMKLKKII